MSVDVKHCHTDDWEHVVHFYDADAGVVESASSYLIDGLKRDATAVVIATHTHRTAFEQRIKAASINLGDARLQGRLVECDAETLISTFVKNDTIDTQLFDINVGEVVRSAAKAGRPVYAFGEMVSLLWDQGSIHSAIALEELWNELGKQAAFSLFCAYPSASVAGVHHGVTVDTIRALHTGEVTISNELHVGVEHFDYATASVSAARHYLVQLLQRWRLEHFIDRAAIIVTELAANAIVHGQSSFDLVISDTEGSLRIVVSDTSSSEPRQKQAGPDAASGRGLAMVDTLCQSWGYELTAPGKSVWATLAPEIKN